MPVCIQNTHRYNSYSWLLLWLAADQQQQGLTIHTSWKFHGSSVGEAYASRHNGISSPLSPSVPCTEVPLGFIISWRYRNVSGRGSHGILYIYIVCHGCPNFMDCLEAPSCLVVFLDIQGGEGERRGGRGMVLATRRLAFVGLPTYGAHTLRIWCRMSWSHARHTTALITYVR